MRIVLYLLIASCWLRVANPIFASQTVFSDNFDDGSGSDWTVQRNLQWDHPDQPCLDSGQPANWAVVNGEFGITINGGPSCTTTITPNLDLTNINAFSFAFDWHFQDSITMDRNVALLWKDANNWYGIKVIGTELRIEKVVDGRSWSLANNWTNYPFAIDQHYHFVLSIQADNTITVSINGQEVLKTADQVPFIRGFKTVGLMASTGAIRYSTSYFDNIVVSSLENQVDVTLHVPLIKQWDPSWKDATYDKASAWSTKPTIGRWGCALSSAAMLLQYYGIDHLPNTTIVTPYTLNAWLNDQPDGYISEGALNWMAITRLTYQMSGQLHTPKLEYRWQNFDKNGIKNEIDKKQPVVLNLPGHFVVADGYTASDDILIKDSAYTYDHLSQHHDQPTSIRTFKPSQTDLSYIMVAHNGTAQVGITHQNPDQYSEYIQDPIDQTKNKAIFFTTLAQPTTGDYEITVSSPNQSEDLTIYTYTKQGEVTIHHQTISEPTTFLLHFSLTDKSTLEKIAHPLSFRELLLQLYQQREISNRYIFLQLDRLAGYAENNIKNHSRYVSFIKHQIEDFSPYITTNAQMALKEKMI